MLGRNKPQLQLPNNFLRPGASPLKRTETHKENLPSNPIFANNYGKPLISPKKQYSDRHDRQMLDNALTHKAQQFKQHKSPRQMNTERQMIVCCNHPSKKAEFRTSLEEGEYFCGRCAAQLATQGCKVEMLDISGGQSMRVSKRNELPHLPQYQNEPIYHEIMDILKMCNMVVGEHSSNIQKFSGLQEQYNQQVDLTSAFYDQLIDIIEEMKNDHLADLMQERDKYTQIADIENDNLRENIIEVNGIKSDIQHHMEEVLQGIQASGDTSECRESLEHYRQKLTLFRHQTQEQHQTLAQVTKYSQQQIDHMLGNFENFLKVMWDQDTQHHQQEAEEPVMPYKQLNSAMTVKNIHQILPKGVNYDNCQNKRAFRNLEDEQEEENLHERKSPNFKKI